MFLFAIMDETILDRLSNVDLHEEESGCIVLDDQDIQAGLQEADLSVLAHISGDRLLHLEGFKSAMGNAWKCGSFSMQRVDTVFYQIFFGTQDTVDFVLSNGPWNFENNLVLVRPFTPISEQHSLCLSREYFWVLLTGLPRICYTLDVARKLSKVYASCHMMQIREDKLRGTKYFRFRILVDLTKPLQRLLRIATPDDVTHGGLLQYERLPIFCFHCGCMGHRFRICPSLPAVIPDQHDFPYGPWLGGVDNISSDQLLSFEPPQPMVQPAGSGSSSAIILKSGARPDCATPAVERASATDLVTVDHLSATGTSKSSNSIPQKRLGSEVGNKSLPTLTTPTKLKTPTAAVARQPRRSP